MANPTEVYMVSPTEARMVNPTEVPMVSPTGAPMASPTTKLLPILALITTNPTQLSLLPTQAIHQPTITMLTTPTFHLLHQLGHIQTQTQD